MRKLISVCVLTLCLFLTGCSEKVPDETTITVNKKGEITYTVVEDFQKDFYDLEGLQKDIEDEIATYNQKFGSDPLALKLLEEQKGTVVMQLTFTEARFFEDYYYNTSSTGATLFVGTLEEAREAEYDLEGEFLGADGSLTDIGSLSKPESLKVLITGEVLKVQVPGEIQCVSPSGSVQIVGKKEAAISEEAGQACIIYK
ncbi:MAG: hypothetical protein HFI29_00240 [Lachnospiraceae bacterium]|jgi:hypothetical protein|nr:hypothetical protein [Lachnospiraceae bacterium]